MEIRKLKELNELIKSLQVINKKEVNPTNKFITSQAYDITLANGYTIRREQLLKGGLEGSAALIVPLTKERNVILTVEPRVFTQKTVGVGIPAGYIEQGEEPMIAAKRELMEETGYAAQDMIDLGGFYQDMGVSAAYNRIFLAKDVVKINEQHLDDGEFVKYFTCTLDDALELIDLGYIEGCNAIIALNRTNKYLRKVR